MSDTLQANGIPPIIMTARMDSVAQPAFDALREAHFPADINFLKAHLTLFHKLPGREIESIRKTFALFRDRFPLEAVAGSPYSLGRGVAIRIECPALEQIRREFSTLWEVWLSPQDSNAFRPHVTVQNKVSPEKSRSLLATLNSSFTPFAFEITGIDLWYYTGGPWKPVHD